MNDCKELIDNILAFSNIDLPDDVVYNLVEEIKKHYPQLNNKTKVKKTDNDRVMVNRGVCSFTIDASYTNIPGIKAKLQRIFGEITGKAQHQNKGYAIALVQPAREKIERIELITFFYRCYHETVCMRCGYDCREDVLFIKKVWEE